MDFSKQPSESFPLRINYASWLTSGESLVSVSGYVDDVYIPPTGSGVLAGYEIQDQTYVQLSVRDGVDNTDYKLTFRVLTSEAENYEYDLTMRVREDCSCVYVNEDFCYRLRYNDLENKLYIVPSPGDTFGKNLEYKVTIKKGLPGLNNQGEATTPLVDDYTFSFTSQFCPLFTTLTRVKLEMGPDAAIFYDDTIYRIIHKNSKDAIDAFNVGHCTNYTYDYFGCDDSEVPYIFRKYVECKTAHDLLNLLDMIRRGQGGLGTSKSKTLGDMTIRYGGENAALSNPNTDPNKKKGLYDCWSEYYDLITNMAITDAVRGRYDTSKGHVHPVDDALHHRIIRNVPLGPSLAGKGPHERSLDWQYGITNRRRW